jgi:hypothetical protein
MKSIGLFAFLGTIASASAFTCRFPTTSRPTSSTALFDIAPQQPNEFPRPLKTDRILKTTSGKRRANRDHQLTIEANEEECASLAKRFDLKNLASLQAELSLRPPPQYTSNSGGILTVEVEGKIVAHLTQTCVRTNEDFELDVEFPIYSVVKPVAANFMLEDVGDGGDKPVKAKKKTSNNLRSDRVHNVNDMMELQNMLGQLDDYDEDVVEDESIYSLATGSLDVGELVAQSFWLSLDPYPKKPGTGPTEISISG